MAEQACIYRVKFINQDQVYEVFVKEIFQSDMWGFIELEGFVFGHRSELLVDPAEEKLKQEFTEVERSYIPLQSIIRIDEVKKEGVSKISQAKGSVTAFPVVPPPLKK